MKNIQYILILYSIYKKKSLFIHDMTSAYASFFVENTSNNLNANIASAALIWNDHDDELILWSKKIENKNERTKLKKNLNNDDISHRMKRRTLIWQLRINVVAWDEKKSIEQTTIDITLLNALERQTNLRVYYVVDAKTI